MHIGQIFKNNKTTLSFEFFPPKTKVGFENLFKSIKDLSPLNPSYVSVTYGAGGSTRELTQDLIVRIKKETDLTVASHLTCVGSTKDDIATILERYNEIGIRNIMALRGDPPTGQKNFIVHRNGFRYASDLVAFIKKHFPTMGIGVAGFPEGHPTTRNRLKEIDYLKEKVDAGADYICTQLFFENRDFYDFCERCELANINIPIIAGIMPITSLKTMHRMAELSPSSRFPARLLKSLYRANNEEQVEMAGIHWTAEQVRDLIDRNVKGIHFYTLNKSVQTKKICESIGVSDSAQFNR